MKKKAVALSLAALLLFSLAGCQSKASSEEGSSPESPLETGKAAGGSIAYLSHDPDAIGYQSCTPAGMYHIEIEDGQAKIKYWDYETKQDTYLCASPNCEHNDESCTAYIGSNGMAPQIASTDTHLFLFYYGYNDGQSEATPPRIEIANPDGSARKTLYTFGAAQEIGEGVAADDGALYLIVSDLTIGDGLTVTQQQLIRLAIDTQQTTTLQTWDSGQTFLMGSNENQLVIKTLSLSDGDQKMAAYDPATGETTELDAYNQEQTYGYAVGSRLFDFDFAGGAVNLRVKNWADGSSFTLDNCFASVNGGAGLLPVGFYSNQLFVSSVTGSDENGIPIVKQYAIDCDKKEVTEILFADPVTNRPLNLVGTVGPDESVLVVEQNQYSGSDQQSYETTALATISLADYLNGNENFSAIN